MCAIGEGLVLRALTRIGKQVVDGVISAFGLALSDGGIIVRVIGALQARVSGCIIVTACRASIAVPLVEDLIRRAHLAFLGSLVVHEISAICARLRCLIEVIASYAHALP